MIYETANFANPAISVGSGGYSIKDLLRFTYSFCTVPTNDLSGYKPDSTAVHRVRNLTGGNYWGNPSQNGVASSIKEIFNNNFRNAFTRNIRATIRSTLSAMKTDFAYFDLL
jgi:hypothetical protein